MPLVCEKGDCVDWMVPSSRVLRWWEAAPVFSLFPWVATYTFSSTADKTDGQPWYICLMIRNSHLGRRKPRQNLHLPGDYSYQGTHCCFCSSWWESWTDEVGLVGKTMCPLVGVHVLEVSCLPHGYCIHTQFLYPLTEAKHNPMHHNSKKHKEELQRI